MDRGEVDSEFIDILDVDKLVPTIMSKDPHPDVFYMGIMIACIDGDPLGNWNWNEDKLLKFSVYDLVKILRWAMWIPGEGYY